MIMSQKVGWPLSTLALGLQPLHLQEVHLCELFTVVLHSPLVVWTGLIARMVIDSKWDNQKRNLRALVDALKLILLWWSQIMQKTVNYLTMQRQMQRNRKGAK